MGGFESAWFADLGRSHLLEKIPAVASRTKFLEFCRDDGIGIFDGKVSKECAHSWVHGLQQKVDRITGAAPGTHDVEFTAVLWGGDSTFKSDLVEIHDHCTFPFLDMQMS